MLKHGKDVFVYDTKDNISVLDGLWYYVRFVKVSLCYPTFHYTHGHWMHPLNDVYLTKRKRHIYK